MKNKILKLIKNPVLWVIIFIAVVAAVMIILLGSCGKTDKAPEREPVITSESSEASEASASSSDAAVSTDSAATAVSSETEAAASTTSAEESSSETASESSASTTASVSSTTKSNTPVQTQSKTTFVYVTTTTAKPVTVTTTTTTYRQPTSVTTTTKPITPGVSPNSDFYKQNIYIAGDSIAMGFSAFGILPSSHSLAVGSLSMSNLDWYFPQVKGTTFLSAVTAANPKLLYMSMGMNDVNVTTPEKYAAKYAQVAAQILEYLPNTTIVVAGITPVSNGISFTNNARIKSFNAALAASISAVNPSRVYYFDAFSVLVDPNTQGLRQGYSSGDGIHLATSCYNLLLNNLYNMLDTTSAMQNMQR